MKDNNSQLLKFHNFVPSKLEEIKIFLSSNNKIDDIFQKKSYNSYFGNKLL